MSKENKGIELLDGQFGLIGGGQVLVSMGEPMNFAPLKSKPIAPKLKQEDSGEVASWGEGNDFPQQIIEAAEKSTELPSLLDWMARALQGREVVAMQRYYDAELEQWKFKAVQDDEIDSFLTDNTFKRYMREAATDFFYFWNVFPELIKSVDGKSIAYLGTQDASFCRWSKMDDKGQVKFCYVSANWPDAKVADKTTLKIDVIDPYSVTCVEDVRAKANTSSFVYPISYPSPGKIYYQLAKWNGFLTSGWAEIARAIPTGKRALMNRMLSAKFTLQIPTSYWPMNYKDWGKLKEDEQLEVKRQKLNDINKLLTGIDNTGKTILTEVGYDPSTGKETSGWQIEPIKSAVQDGENLEDSREASEHLMRALGVDPTLVGDGPGKKMGGGSGSDKRVAFNIYVALLQPYRDVILEPLYFIAEYNGWSKKYPRLVFKTVEIELETLDKSHQTSNEVIK